MQFWRGVSPYDFPRGSGLAKEFGGRDL
jgi:hypothetical protein